MPTFTGSRKRQSRLNLTPLASSSPAAKSYPKQNRDRAAAVGYEGSPAKRRKIQTNEGGEVDFVQPPEDNAMLPTPSTSIPQGDAVDSDDEPLQSIQKRAATSKKRSRQQHLDFGSGAPLSSNGRSINVDSPIGLKGKSTALSMSSDDSDDLSSPGKLIRQSKSKMNSSRADKSGAFMGSSAPQITRSTRKAPQAVEESDDDDDVVVPSSRKARPVVVSDDEDEDEDENADENTIVAQDGEETDEVEEDDDEDDMPTTLGKQRRKRERRSSFISSSPPAAIDSDDDLEIIENPRKRRRKDVDQDEEDEDDDVVTPRRHKLKGKRQLTQQEQEDLDEDLDFLGPSSDVDESRGHRAQSSQKNARQQALERLKAKRSQRPLADVPEDTEVVAVDDNEDQDQGEDDYEEYDLEEIAPPTSSRAMFTAEQEDEDFLVDGEDDILGIPFGIPLKFTRYAAMKPKELFKYAVDWMVRKKINPAFQMDDEIYTLTFQKLNDEVSGLVGSKFASSAWKPEFTIAVRSRPGIAYDRLDRNRDEHMFRDKCDACNRTGHPATYQVQFQGRPYHPDSLDDVAGNDDDDEEEGEDDASSTDSSDDGDSPDYDARGQKVAPANTIWYVGKFCMSNARTAHALQHWRLHLYKYVVEWIDVHGYSTDEQLRKREKMSTKKRNKLANKIVDRMENEGQVKILWKEFSSTIREAADAKQGRFSAESP